MTAFRGSIFGGNQHKDDVLAGRYLVEWDLLVPQQREAILSLAKALDCLPADALDGGQGREVNLRAMRNVADLKTDALFEAVREYAQKVLGTLSMELVEELREGFGPPVRHQRNAQNWRGRQMRQGSASAMACAGHLECNSGQPELPGGSLRAVDAARYGASISLSTGFS
jgi:hypothetical protein